MKGARVVFSRDAFINPFYEDCTDGPDYTDIRPVPRKEAENYFSQAPSLKLKAARPLAGTIRCKELTGGPANTIGRIIIDGDKAYLLDESGAVIVLR